MKSILSLSFASAFTSIGCSEYVGLDASLLETACRQARKWKKTYALTELESSRWTASLPSEASIFSDAIWQTSMAERLIDSLDV